MMNKILFVGFSVLFVITSSCSGDNTTSDESKRDSLICILPEPPKLGRLAWLVGEWEYNFEGGRTIESWSEYNSNEMFGTSYTLMGDDTVSSESISIQENYPDLYYIPTVNEQNDAQPIKFKMTELTDDYALFENPTHDFPQKIAYQKIGTDSLVAEISGTMKENPNEISAIKFPMRRIK